ncbi:MAG: radical SAM protein [Desulfobacteraceae bacterium]|nr:radical SAM protein [Desulfobacteraceae bacterium]
MILIFPPVVKPCEPPGGLALLSGALKKHNIEHHVYDANIEGLLFLIHSDIKPESSWTKRALSHRQENIEALKNYSLYKNLDRYKQKLFDINKLLNSALLSKRFKLTLADFKDEKLSPVKSKDLLLASENFKENPFYDYFEACLKQRIQASESEYVGISLCYLSQALTAFALAGWVKHNFKNKKLIFGGGLISTWMSMPDFNNPFLGLVDIFVKGEGERAILSASKVKENYLSRYTPNFDFVPWDSYIAPGRIIPFSTSRGCYWRKCKFCPEKAEKTQYTPVKISEVLNDLRSLSGKYKQDYVHFIDNAIAPALMNALAKNKSQNKRPFSWYGFARIRKELQNLDYLKALRRSGCIMLNLGLESGDQAVLDKMEKGIDLDVASNVLKACKKAGIKTYVYLLFGTPQETEASAEKTLAYVLRHAPFIDFMNLAIFNLPKFSEEASYLRVTQFYEGDLSLYYNFRHPHGWDRKNVREFLFKKFKKNRLLAPIVLKNPPFFTSNHAMFF